LVLLSVHYGDSSVCEPEGWAVTCLSN